MAQKVHILLGARFDQKKLQITTKPVIFGVTYSLEEFVRSRNQGKEESRAQRPDRFDPEGGGQLGEGRSSLLPSFQKDNFSKILEVIDQR